MLDIWEFIKNIVVLFGIFNISIFPFVWRAYNLIRMRVDTQQSIKVDSMRPNRLWYWVGFGFVSAYVFFFIYSSLVSGIGSFTQMLSSNDDAENMIIVLLSDLPVVAGAMVIGYVYGRKLFKK